jgi:hypothetical protein
VVGLAPDDLGDALVADVHDAGDSGHRQPAAVGGANSTIALDAELLLLAIDDGLAAGVLAGKGEELGAGVGRFTGRTGDSEDGAFNSC